VTISTMIVIAILILALTPSKRELASMPPSARIPLQIVRGLSKILLFVAAALVVLGLLLLGLCLASMHR